MERRIDMGPGMLVYRQVQQVESVLGERERLLARDPRCAELRREGLVIDMGHIDNAAVALRQRRRRRHRTSNRGRRNGHG